MLLSSVMTMVDIVRVICKPRAKSRWTVSVAWKDRMSELVEVGDL